MLSLRQSISQSIVRNPGNFFVFANKFLFLSSYLLVEWNFIHYHSYRSFTRTHHATPKLKVQLAIAPIVSNNYLPSFSFRGKSVWQRIATPINVWTFKSWNYSNCAKRNRPMVNLASFENSRLKTFNMHFVHFGLTIRCFYIIQGDSRNLHSSNNFQIIYLKCTFLQI
mgnify:CR=1 FL=1